GLREEALDLAGARNRQLVFIRQFVDTQNRDDVLQVFVALQNTFHHLGRAVVVLPDDQRVENAAGGGQRIDRRVNADCRDIAAQVGGGVEVREGRGRRRVGVIVGGHINGLYRGDRPLLGRCDALLQ